MLCDRLPRVRFAEIPTPLEEATRLVSHLGGPRLFFKRDDLTGLCSGGNKVRVMEFAMGEIIEQGCDTVVSSASAQSNKLREIAAAAGRLGLRCKLLLQGERPSSEPEQGNLLLTRLLGAEVDYLSPRECAGNGIMEAQERLRDQLESEGHKVAVMDRRLSYGIAATVAYVDAAEELTTQFREKAVEPDFIYVTVGAGMTMAGLVLGLKHLGCRARVVGVSAASSADEVSPHVVEHVRRAAEKLGISTRVEVDDFDLVDDRIGPGYGVVTAPVVETIELVARHHGLVLDPVYNGKTMLSLCDRVREGSYTRSQTVVYINTGGALYGEPDYVPCDEAHPVRPISPYGLSKATLEAYLAMLLPKSVSLTTLRLANVYGPRQDPHGEAGVVAIFTERMMRDDEMTIFGDGEQTRDFVYVRDVASAVVAALSVPLLPGGRNAVNIGTGVPTSVNQVFRALAASTGYGREPGYQAARDGDVRHIYLDVAHAASVLNWRPTVGLEEGLKVTVESFAE